MLQQWFPQFTYAKGKLVLEEKKMISFLSQGHHNLDYTFALNFKEPKDARDERPPVYNCRLVFPSPFGNVHKSPFWSCRVRRLRTTMKLSWLNRRSEHD